MKALLGPTGKLAVRTLKEEQGEDFFDYMELCALIGATPATVAMATDEGGAVGIYAGFSAGTARAYLHPENDEQVRRVGEVLALDACWRTYREGRRAGYVDPHAY